MCHSLPLNVQTQNLQDTPGGTRGSVLDTPGSTRGSVLAIPDDARGSVLDTPSGTRGSVLIIPGAIRGSVLAIRALTVYAPPSATVEPGGSRSSEGWGQCEIHACFRGCVCSIPDLLYILLPLDLSWGARDWQRGQ